MVKGAWPPNVLDELLNLKIIITVYLDYKKDFPYLLPSIGDPGVQAVGPLVTISRQPGDRLPLLYARPAVTFPATEHHCPLAGTKLYCFVTEAHRCEQLAQGCYAVFAPSRI